MQPSTDSVNSKWENGMGNIKVRSRKEDLLIEADELVANFTSIGKRSK